ncbi:hypothetical protein C8F04DRAFT_1184269 [Mycena alexandri]|uniref:Uncharacterized protein n=1 Tax=Mycena alexandri TaxID=1745969 RepID=A0AAD6SVQ0_9AGAR|nr:hypothetical protein C8F04DRAFT_1184269 [Mycena alexandri]
MKRQQRDSENLRTTDHTGGVATMTSFPYPINDDGVPIPPHQLHGYLLTHIAPIPTCMCDELQKPSESVCPDDICAHQTPRFDSRSMPDMDKPSSLPTFMLVLVMLITDHPGFGVKLLLCLLQLLLFAFLDHHGIELRILLELRSNNVFVASPGWAGNLFPLPAHSVKAEKPAQAVFPFTLTLRCRPFASHSSSAAVPTSIGDSIVVLMLSSSREGERALEELSFDLRMSTIVLPGIGVPGKLLVAQISPGLVVFLCGIIGHQEPLFSCADWSVIETEVEPKTRSIVMNLADATAPGPLFRMDDTGAVKVAHPAVGLRIVLENQAAFWALAYLTAKALPRAAPLVFCAAEHNHITALLDFFKNDEGQEFLGDEGRPPGAPVDDLAPPGYTDTILLDSRYRTSADTNFEGITVLESSGVLPQIEGYAEGEVWRGECAALKSWPIAQLVLLEREATVYKWQSGAGESGAINEESRSGLYCSKELGDSDWGSISIISVESVPLDGQIIAYKAVAPVAGKPHALNDSAGNMR